MSVTDVGEIHGGKLTLVASFSVYLLGTTPVSRAAADLVGEVAGPDFALQQRTSVTIRPVGRVEDRT